MKLLTRIAIAIAHIGVVATSAAEVWTDGVATHFQAIGYPYGACGVPESVLAAEDGLDYVALNVFDAPRNYQSPGSFGNRPLKGSDTVWLGMYDNGRNCGRWVDIEMGDECDGSNGGEAGSSLCTGGAGWFSDSRNGSHLLAIVTDQCTDNNLWCRDIAGHLDIHTSALNHFRDSMGGWIAPLAFEQGGAFLTSSFNNRKIRWQFTVGPDTIGDVHIYFSQGSKPEWKRIMVTNLPNGIHGVEQWTGQNSTGSDSWERATMEGDMGQLFILPRPDLPEPVKIRIWDAQDSLVHGGRTYSFHLPEECRSECATPATKVDYHAEGGVNPDGIAPLRSPQFPSRESWNSRMLLRHFDLLGRLHNK